MIGAGNPNGRRGLPNLYGCVYWVSGLRRFPALNRSLPHETYHASGPAAANAPFHLTEASDPPRAETIHDLVLEGIEAALKKRGYKGTAR